MALTQDLKEDLQLLAFAGAAASAGIVANMTGQRWLAWPAIGCVDLYLVVVLVLTALRAEDKDFHTRNKWVMALFPRRVAGMALMLLLLTASVTGFAGLYVGTDVFSPRKDPLDALFSSVLTLGFGDFSPRKGYGQVVVLTQILSSIVLLVGIFPLLISRLTTPDSPDT